MTWCFKTSLQLPKGQLSFVEKWPLMNSSDLLFILLTYFLFIFKVGPYFMDKRAPLQIKKFLLFYNVVKIVSSTCLCYEFISYIMNKGLFPRLCEYDDATIYTIAALYWKYMATKVLDLWDTVFFVLRKKNNQITFLHVYHHVFMPVITWCCLKYDPTDHWGFMAAINCGVHAVMYTYYGLAAVGPSFAKYLWWKKYLTQMQLIQFVLVIAHVIIQTYTSQCPIHPSIYWICLPNILFFIILFVVFYRRRYSNNIDDDKVAQVCCAKRND